MLDCALVTPDHLARRIDDQSQRTRRFAEAERPLPCGIVFGVDDSRRVVQLLQVADRHNGHHRRGCLSALGMMQRLRQHLQFGGRFRVGEMNQQIGSGRSGSCLRSGVPGDDDMAAGTALRQRDGRHRRDLAQVDSGQRQLMVATNRRAYGLRRSAARRRNARALHREAQRRVRR